MIEIPTFKFALREGLDESYLPYKAHDTDTGYDVRCAESEPIHLSSFDKTFIRLGIKMFCPPGWWVELRPRSSTFAKKHLNCLYGVIDNGFERELVLACQYMPPINRRGVEWWEYSHGYNPYKLTIEPGEKIGQLVPVKIERMNVVGISNEEYDSLCKIRGGARGTGGFGSSGN